MGTPGLLFYDKRCNELTGMALKYATSKNGQSDSTQSSVATKKLREYYLRVGQKEQSVQAPVDIRDKEISSQLNLRRFGLVRGGRLDTLIALSDKLGRETKTIEPVAQHHWRRRPYRIFVGRFISSVLAVNFHVIQFCSVPSASNSHVSRVTILFASHWLKQVEGISFVYQFSRMKLAYSLISGWATQCTTCA